MGDSEQGERTDGPDQSAGGDEHRPPSAFRVAELVNVENRQDMPGHLIFMPKDATPSSPEQESAREELEKVAAVLRAVFQTKHEQIFRDYFTRLLAIAWGTFTGSSFRQESLTDLVHLRNEIVYRAGGLIKAEYNGRLAIAVTKAIGLILVVSGVAQLLITTFSQYRVVSGEYWQAFGSNARWDSSISMIHLGALLAAAMIGLLFASMSRNLDPTFETLMTPDADLMQPWVRLLYFGIAISIIALIFLLRVVTVQFGEAFSTARISDDLLTAILIGLLLGLAERALPSQVEKWSRDLVTAARRSE